ncbi:MAG TPA: helix-turn-helix domain-containing protein [Pyrinomonadaceae bacterium]|nr:helix-turn-helix domain-containing protein [Pyrinomonadaceae bacterium]
MKNLISSKEAAEKLGLSLRRVQALITSGRLPAQKIGNSYVVNEKDLEFVKERTPGRPSKTQKVS